MSKVAIIGCGPAGLIAARGADKMGFEVDLYSVKQKSPIGGAQYLHANVLSENDPVQSEVLYTFKMGSDRGYAEKVYGSPDAKVSFSNYQVGPNIGYSLQETYDILWDRWEENIINLEVGVKELDDMLDDSEYDCVFSSMPRKDLCRFEGLEGHNFDSQEIILVPMSMTQVPGTIVYSGRPEDLWYRTSFLDGEGWTEYSTASIGNEAVKFCLDNGGKLGYKPLKTDCDCHEHNGKFSPVGRFGMWEKSALLHHIPTIVWNKLA